MYEHVKKRMCFFVADDGAKRLAVQENLACDHDNVHPDILILGKA